MGTNNFKEQIKPFFWVEHESTVSVCLNVGEYKTEIFQSREDEGFEGNGYDWESLARVFTEDKEALKEFILQFKKVCENEVLIMDLFSRTELD